MAYPKESIIRQLIAGYIWYNSNGCSLLADKCLERIKHQLSEA